MKKWLTFFSTIWLGLSTHKLRSFLTILGVVIGVASVITLMSIGRGSEAQILSNIQTLGSNLITIRPGASIFGGVRGFAQARTLTIEDADAISQTISNITAVSPSNSSNLQLVVGSKNTNATVNGVNPEYFSINNLTVANGTLFSDDDYDNGNVVVVLGSNVATTLFPDSNPIGQQMRMGNIIAYVTGVLNSKGASFGSSDDAIFMPLTAMEKTVALSRTPQGGHIVSNISLTVANSTETKSVTDAVTTLLRTRHGLAATADNDFNIQSVQELAATLTQTMSTLTLLLGAIAAISLLVGGIGVMNIMLVSVLERTREIGIRKALGARQTDIWSQFLVEAAFLSFAGGIIGVGVGWGVSFIVSKTGFLATLVTADVVILAVSVSIGIGVFFGFYPAWNASRLDPIQALRSE